MEEVISALMRKDGITYTEAKQKIESTVKEIFKTLLTGDTDEGVNIWVEKTGLDPAYMMNIMC